MDFIAIIALVFVLIFALRAFYHLFDHTKQEPYTKLDPLAEIVDIQTEKVEYSKNGAKYKTTVFFSDGFQFITHKTNRKEGFFTYQISIDDSLRKEIIESAIAAHNQAVEKQTNNM